MGKTRYIFTYQRFYFHNDVKTFMMSQPKSLYISRAVSDFYETEIEIWAGFCPVGNTEKKLG